jgi:hypothetical protein
MTKNDIQHLAEAYNRIINENDYDKTQDSVRKMERIGKYVKVAVDGAYNSNHIKEYMDYIYGNGLKRAFSALAPNHFHGAMELKDDLKDFLPAIAQEFPVLNIIIKLFEAIGTSEDPRYDQAAHRIFERLKSYARDERSGDDYSWDVMRYYSRARQGKSVRTDWSGVF